MADPDLTPDLSPVPVDDIAESTNIVTVHQSPGSPLETKADREANEAYRADLEACTAPTEVPHSGLVIDTADPASNYQSRDNIVPAGPGSVEDYLVPGDVKPEDEQLVVDQRLVEDTPAEAPAAQAAPADPAS